MGLSLQNRPVDLKEYTLAAYKEGTAWLRDYVTAIKNGQLHPYTKLERRAREATRNEPWGPTGTLLNELAQACSEPTDCQIVFAVIQLRLGYPPAKWRNVYKALTLLEFLLKRGPENCVRLTQRDLLCRLQDLEGFQFVSPDGKDLGANVRLRAQAVHTLAKDERRLREERDSFRGRRQEYSGFSRGDMLSGRGSSAGSGSGSLRRSRSDGGDASSYTNYTAGSAAAGEATPQSKLQSSSRGAGEMKGVSMEDNKAQLAALKRLLERPGNRACADCSGGGAASRASWASINTGVFLCMRCAGIHRGLGVHISQVRSCTLDTWLPEQVRFMARTGSAAANAHYEARLDPARKPSYHSPELEAFIRRKYNGEYAKEGAEWPPAEAFSNEPGQEGPSAAPLQQAGSSLRTPLSEPPGAVRQTQSAQEDEGFGESAFAGPGLQRAPSAPNLMDFGADTPTPPGSTGSASQLEPAAESIPIRQHPHEGVGMDGFEQLMAASAQPNFLDDHSVVSILKGYVDAMTPEPNMHSRHMNALGITPPRSLLSSFSAAAKPGQGMGAAEACEFGPPTDFSAPGGAHAAGSSTATSSRQPSSAAHGLRPELAPQPGPAYSGMPAEMGRLSGGMQQPQASSAAPQISTYRALEARQAGQASGMGRSLYGPRSARELSFEGEPAPEWERSTAYAPPRPGAIYSAGFSASMQSVLQQHLQPLPNSSPAIAPLPKAAGKPYRPPGIPGGVPDQALVPAQQQQAFAPAEDAWYAQTGLQGRPSTQQAPHNNKALARVQGPRRGSSDPSGCVMEDLLAHAVDSMRIKNASKTQLARRAEQPQPSLLVRWLRRNRRWEPASVQPRFEAKGKLWMPPARVWYQEKRKGSTDAERL